MRSVTHILLLCLVSVSCKKAVDQNHYEITLEKISAFDNKAFVGTWERIEMTTWDYQDNATKDYSNTPLKITKNHWITEGEKREYDLNIHLHETCDFYVTSLSLETDGELRSVPFGQYGWGDQLRIWIYTYPDDPEISRIDRRYKPAGYPD